MGNGKHEYENEGNQKNEMRKLKVEIEMEMTNVKWDENETLIGTHIMYSRDITTIQIAAASGIDFVVFDLEHHRIQRGKGRQFLWRD